MELLEQIIHDLKFTIDQEPILEIGVDGDYPRLYNKLKFLYSAYTALNETKINKVLFVSYYFKDVRTCRIAIGNAMLQGTGLPKTHEHMDAVMRQISKEDKTDLIVINMVEC